MKSSSSTSTSAILGRVSGEGGTWRCCWRCCSGMAPLALYVWPHAASSSCCICGAFHPSSDGASVATVGAGIGSGIGGGVTVCLHAVTLL